MDDDECVDESDDAFVDDASLPWTNTDGLSMQQSPLTLDPELFVEWFATINTYTNPQNQTDSIDDDKRPAVGHNQLTPSPFLYFCGKGNCSYQSNRLDVFKAHYHTCRGGKNKKDEDRPWACREPGCDKTYMSNHILRQHVERVHEWIPSPCPDCPDDPDKLYNTKAALTNHRNRTHGKFHSQCPLRDHPECTCPDKIFTFRSYLVNHLNQTHHTAPPEHDALLPRPKKVKNDLKCPADGCQSKAKLECDSVRRKHLRNVHK